MTNFKNVKMVSQPHGLKVKLFPHQLASIYKMEHLEETKTIETENYVKYTKIGINSDLTGFGKTLAIIGLIIRDKMEWNLEFPHTHEMITSDSRGLVKTYTTARFDKLPTNLILVSQSIIGQWEKELQKSDLKFTSVISNKDIEKITLENYDVVLVSPSFYNKIVIMNPKFAWKRFIFDEPGNLRISGMLPIQAGFYWFVTATPLSIYNNHKNCKGSFMRELFYYNNFNSDNELFIKDITIQNNPEFVRESFDMPPTEHLYHNCYQPILNAISCFVSNTIKIMIEAGNIEGAIIALGGTKTTNIVELIKEKKQNELQVITEKISTCSDEIRKQNYISQKDNIIRQISLIEERFQNMLNDNCLICCEKFKNPILEPGCQNLFCGECLLTWLQRKNSCPACRIRVNPSDLIYVESRDIDNDDSAVENKYEKEIRMTKVQKVVDIIRKNKDGKFLVFSEYDSTFYPICDALREHKIGFIEIKGCVKNREKMLDLFKSGKIPVLFLNSTFNGAGLNLTESTDIILCHQMTESQETQIIGRANRIGRTQKLFVHHLLVNS
jgi:SNF2 family DNA or RNA helicase